MEKHLKFNWVLRLLGELCEAPTRGAAFSCKWKHSEKHVYKSILKQQQENNGIFVVKCSVMLLLTSAEKTKTESFEGRGGWVELGLNLRSMTESSVWNYSRIIK